MAGCSLFSAYDTTHLFIFNQTFFQTLSFLIVCVAWSTGTPSTQRLPETWKVIYSTGARNVIQLELKWISSFQREMLKSCWCLFFAIKESIMWSFKADSGLRRIQCQGDKSASDTEMLTHEGVTKAWGRVPVHPSPTATNAFISPQTPAREHLSPSYSESS